MHPARIKGRRCLGKAVSNMSEQKFEESFYGIFRCDFAAGTEEFRESLLSRCLEALSQGSLDEGNVDGSADDRMGGGAVPHGGISHGA